MFYKFININIYNNLFNIYIIFIIINQIILFILMEDKSLGYIYGQLKKILNII